MLANQSELHDQLLNSDVKKCRLAFAYLKYDFKDIPDKRQLENDLHCLLNSPYSEIRSEVLDCLEYNFPYVIDKEQAWNDLIRLVGDPDKEIRNYAIEALGKALPYIKEPEKGWLFLYDLILSEEKDTKIYALRALRRLRPGFKAISRVPNIWNDLWNALHKFTDNRYDAIRFSAAELIGLIFQNIPNKEKAWEDLIKLSSDPSKMIRQIAPQAMGWSFQYMPKELKQSAWDELCLVAKGSDPEARWGEQLQ